MGNPTTDYQSTAQSYDLPPPAYASGSTQAWSSTNIAAHRRKRTWRRAIHWTLTAILLLLLWRALDSAFSGSSGGRTGPYPPTADGEPTHWPDWSEPIQLPRSEWPSFSGGGLFGGPFYSTTTNFTLDPAAAVLFVHAQGPGYGGRVDYVVGSEGSKDVKVGVEVVYNVVASRDRLTVAKMEDKNAGRQGVGVYTEKRGIWFRNNDLHIRVYITVALPPTSKPYHTLESDTENIAATTHDLGSRLTFTRFTSHSQNGRLSLNGGLVATEQVSLHNSNGRIEASAKGGAASLITPVLEADCENGALELGNVVVSDSVSATSSNGHVQGTFHVARKLVLRSENGAVDARVYVEKNKNSSSSSSSGKVDVDATSSNGHVELTYVEQDPSVLLFSNVHSENGRASVSHAPTFTGQIELGTEVGSLHYSPPSSSSSEKRIWETIEEHKGWVARKLTAKLYRKDQPDLLGSTVITSEAGSVTARF